jgi:hypothetical protein
VVLAAVLITELLISREITRKSVSAGHYKGKDIEISLGRPRGKWPRGVIDAQSC